MIFSVNLTWIIIFKITIMKKIAEFYLVVVAIFVVSFSDGLKEISLDIKDFSLDTDEFLNA
ncbi:hypothetical protein GCM10009430_18990 [Aquimarina litoralis]|uniref:Uncharacterized protein n=1 Tax=Aquimarina litoralis TaxID=584605 RepID=A0ABP3U0M1_9FLAO